MALYKHRADRRLRESERRYEATLSSIGDGVIATDEKGQVTFSNPVAEAMTGWTRDAAIGLPLASVYLVMDVDKRPVRETPIARALASSLVCKTADRAILISRDGQQFPIDEKCAPIIGDSGSVSGAVLVFSDTSDRRRAASTLQAAQANLARMSRVTTMGQMTASIAHEVNQPLMAVVMNAEACLKWMDGAHRDVGEARAAAERAISEAHRAAKIIERIRAIARNTPVTFETVDLNEIIEGILTIVQPEFRHQEIAVDIELQPGPLLVVGDRIQLQQVMLNLLSNATDAINGCAAPNRRAIIRSWTGTSGEIWWPWRTPERASRQIVSTRFSSHSSPPNRPASVWVCRSAVRSSRPTAVNCASSRERRRARGACFRCRRANRREACDRYSKNTGSSHRGDRR
ncbi:PAS domain S-box protein [Rhodopseudomonas sp. P2A-2r]|nr:PAS domain S-box protein [Rhodopseudomonas sp. P2A-2r]UZE49832.1 PAS domain S-box protein [Rhodopseudomonas sp. P2A-2r]